jgi:pentatricopeptide repeat protein
VVEVDKIEESASEEKKPPTRRTTGKVNKPPILSPTLGEIYIAQGRFEEAIEVFKQLLQKDSQNTRFRRKIDDLQKILTKKNLGV